MGANEVIERIQTAFGAGDADGAGDAALANTYAEDAVVTHPLVPEPLQGRAAIRHFEQAMFAGFSDITWQANNIVESEDSFVVEFRVRGTHSKPLAMGQSLLPPSNKTVDLRAASVVRLSPDGLIAEEHRYFDTGAMMAQLGLAPEA